MRLLALETSSVACSVAVEVDGQLSERHAERPREHTQLLLPMIEELMTEANLEFSELDALVLGNGPGSFIGLRIAASVAQGIAFSAGLPVLPVSSFQAAAEEVFEKQSANEVVVTADAHMNEVYVGSFVQSPEGDVIAKTVECLHPIAKLRPLLDTVVDGRVSAGSGWERYPLLMEMNRQQFTGHTDVFHPHAKYLLPAARRNWQLGRAISAEDIEPGYLRQQVAQARSAT